MCDTLIISLIPPHFQYHFNPLPNTFYTNTKSNNNNYKINESTKYSLHTKHLVLKYWREILTWNTLVYYLLV